MRRRFPASNAIATVAAALLVLAAPAAWAGSDGGFSVDDSKRKPLSSDSWTDIDDMPVMHWPIIEMPHWPIIQWPHWPIIVIYRPPSDLFVFGNGSGGDVFATILSDAASDTLDRIAPPSVIDESLLRDVTLGTSGVSSLIDQPFGTVPAVVAPSTSAVPTPGTIAVIGLGLLARGRRRRRS